MPAILYETALKGKALAERIERKFYVAPQKVGFAYGLLRQICCRDGEFPSELINSLYFDTADLEQHNDSLSGNLVKNKVRIRWYGEDKHIREKEAIFIELKSRRGFSSTKQRLKLEVPSENLRLPRLGHGIIPRSFLMDTLARFGYFPPPILPVIKISYWRYRFRELLSGQHVALDTNIRSTMILPGEGNGEKELELPGSVIEIKGRSIELPLSLKYLGVLDIDWSRFSKYSTCIDAHKEVAGSIGRLSPSGRII